MKRGKPLRQRLASFKLFFLHRTFSGIFCDLLPLGAFRFLGSKIAFALHMSEFAFQFYVAAIPVGLQCAGFKRFPDGATGFIAMIAIPEPAGIRKRFDIRKTGFDASE